MGTAFFFGESKELLAMNPVDESWGHILSCSEKNCGIISVTVELLCKNDVFFISIIFGLTTYGKQEPLFLNYLSYVVGLFFLKLRICYEYPFVSITGFYKIPVAVFYRQGTGVEKGKKIRRFPPASCRTDNLPVV